MTSVWTPRRREPRVAELVAEARPEGSELGRLGGCGFFLGTKGSGHQVALYFVDILLTQSVEQCVVRNPHNPVGGQAPLVRTEGADDDGPAGRVADGVDQTRPAEAVKTWQDLGLSVDGLAHAAEQQRGFVVLRGGGGVCAVHGCGGAPLMV